MRHTKSINHRSRDAALEHAKVALQRDGLLAALEKTEQAFYELFAQCAVPILSTTIGASR